MSVSQSCSKVVRIIYDIQSNFATVVCCLHIAAQRCIPHFDNVASVSFHNSAKSTTLNLHCVFPGLLSKVYTSANN